MLSIERFTEQDVNSIRNSIKDRKSVYPFLALLYLPLALLFGLLGLLPGNPGYLVVTIFFIASFTVTILKDWIMVRYRSGKDLKKRIKFSGLILVTEKDKDNEVIYTNYKEVKKVKIQSEEAFKKIEYGDKIYIEISKHCKYIFRLEKDGEDLLDANK